MITGFLLGCLFVIAWILLDRWLKEPASEVGKLFAEQPVYVPDKKYLLVNLEDRTVKAASSDDIHVETIQAVIGMKLLWIDLEKQEFFKNGEWHAVKNRDEKKEPEQIVSVASNKDGTTFSKTVFPADNLKYPVAGL